MNPQSFHSWLDALEGAAIHSLSRQDQNLNLVVRVPVAGSGAEPGFYECILVLVNLREFRFQPVANADLVLSRLEDLQKLQLHFAGAAQVNGQRVKIPCLPGNMGQRGMLMAECTEWLLLDDQLDPVPLEKLQSLRRM